jgi:hypothetical protein
MPTVFRLSGLAEASISSETHDVNFVLKVSNARRRGSSFPTPQIGIFVLGDRGSPHRQR